MLVFLLLKALGLEDGQIPTLATVLYQYYSPMYLIVIVAVISYGEFV